MATLPQRAGGERLVRHDSGSLNEPTSMPRLSMQLHRSAQHAARPHVEILATQLHSARSSHMEVVCRSLTQDEESADTDSSTQDERGAVRSRCSPPSGGVTTDGDS